MCFFYLQYSIVSTSLCRTTMLTSTFNNDQRPFEKSVCRSSSKAAVVDPSRLKMKPDVVLRRLAIAVASNDHSYMPQLVSVAVGKNRRSLQEIRDIRIPSNEIGRAHV